MNRRLLTALALAMPLGGLAAGWAQTHQAAQQGVEWEVPIAGYDPRDLLRGHYVLYRYDWPGALAGEADLAYQPALCIQGKAPVIARVTALGNGLCRQIVRAAGGFGDPEGGVAQGRLYVSQAEGRRLEGKLFDPRLQAAVRIRVREDGHLTPLRLVFRPRAAVPEQPSPTPPPITVAPR